LYINIKVISLTCFIFETNHKLVLKLASCSPLYQNMSEICCTQCGT